MMTWQHISECVWRITDDGCLEIAPADGKFGFLTGGEETHHDVSHRDLVFFDWPWLSYGPHIFSAKILPGVSAAGSLGFMFNGCTSLKTVDLPGLDTSNVTSMAGMFYYCKALVDLDLSSFDTLLVTCAYSMFEECTSLTSLDLSFFNKTSVVDMSSMFFGCSSLTSLDLSSFNTSNVTDLSYMFAGCSSLVSPELSSFDTSNVTDMSYMFFGCSSLNSLDLSSFDTSKVTDMRSMFEGCTSLISLDLSSFNTSNVSVMSRMFDSCSWLTSLDLSNFDTSNVIDMSGMFQNCSYLVHFDLDDFDISNASNKENIFSGCPVALRQSVGKIPKEDQPDSSLISSDINCKNDYVNDNSCWQNISECIWRITENGCLEIAPADWQEGVLDLSDHSHRWPWYAHRQDIVSAKINPGVRPKTLTSIFSGCLFLSSLDLSSIDTSKVTDMSSMFFGCSSLTSIDLSSFDTSKVTDMSSMFFGCSSLTSIDLSSFNTSNVTDLSYMFAGCSSLTSLGLSNFDTSNVTSMKYMFEGCSSLTSLDLSSFDTSKVTDMSSMFEGCSLFASLDLSNFNTSNVTNMKYMFAGCSSLASPELSSFDTSKLTDMCSMFEGCPIAPLQSVAGRLVEKIPDDSSHQNVASSKNLKKATHRRGTKKSKKQKKTQRSWNIGGVIFCFIMFGLPLGYICTQCVFANFVNNQSATNNADSETSISEDVDKQTDTSNESSSENERKTTEENHTDKEEYTDSEVGLTVSLPSYWVTSSFLSSTEEQVMRFEYGHGDELESSDEFAGIVCYAWPGYEDVSFSDISKEDLAEDYPGCDGIAKKKLSSGTYYVISEDNAHTVTYLTIKNDYLIEFQYITANDDAPKHSDFEDMVDSASFSKSDSKKSSGSKSSNSSSKSNKPDGAIDWSEASNHVGETVTVYGKVKDTDYATSSNGRPTFIDIGASYPDSSRVTAVIWEENRSAFSSSPESYYEGKTVCVTGEIYLYEGVCDIEVTSPGQIEVLD